MTAIFVDPLAIDPTPVLLRGRVTIDRGICELIAKHDPTYFPVRGRRVNDLQTLWPYDHFRREMFHAAKWFVGDMAKQGYSLLTAEADVRVFGPYQPRTYTRQLSRAPRVVGFDQTEDPDPTAADFVVQAEFLCRRGARVERATSSPEGVPPS